MELKKKKWCEGDKEYLQSSLAESYHCESENYLRKVLRDNKNKDEIVNTLLYTSFSHNYNFTKEDLQNIQLPIKKEQVPEELMNIFYQFKDIRY